MYSEFIKRAGYLGNLISGPSLIYSIIIDSTYHLSYLLHACQLKYWINIVIFAFVIIVNGVITLSKVECNHSPGKVIID